MLSGNLFHYFETKVERGVLISFCHPTRIDNVFEIYLPGSQGLDIVIDDKTPEDKKMFDIQFYSSDPTNISEKDLSSISLGDSISGKNPDKFPTEEFPLYLTLERVWFRITSDGPIFSWLVFFLFCLEMYKNLFFLTNLQELEFGRFFC